MLESVIPRQRLEPVTFLAGILKMTNQAKFAGLLAAMLTISLASQAGAALQLTPATLDRSGINGIGNDFSSQIATALGTTAGDVDIYKGSLRATETGTVSFYVIASESGFRNGFQIGSNPAAPSASWWETGAGSSNDKAWGSTPVLVGSLNVTQGDYLDSLLRFTTEGGAGPNPVPAGNFSLPSGQFGIFLKKGTAGADFNSLLFGFDDNGANLDDNHDDLIIRAEFQASPLVVAAVPEPASLVVWGVLLSGAAMLRRGMRRKKAGPRPQSSNGVTV